MENYVTWARTMQCILNIKKAWFYRWQNHQIYIHFRPTLRSMGEMQRRDNSMDTTFSQLGTQIKYCACWLCCKHLEWFVWELFHPKCSSHFSISKIYFLINSRQWIDKPLLQQAPKFLGWTWDRWIDAPLYLWLSEDFNKLHFVVGSCNFWWGMTIPTTLFRLKSCFKTHYLFWIEFYPWFNKKRGGYNFI